MKGKRRKGIEFPNIQTTLFLAMWFLMALLLQAVPGYSQPVRIVGTVVSLLDRTPIAGATVMIKGKVSTGTATDLNGKFSIQVEQGTVLEISFIGFEKQTYVVKGKANLIISLKEASAGLNEVVVVGYGTSRKRDLTGAVASVSSDDIRKTVSTSLDQALQGRAAGVMVTQNSGEPGGGVSVRIRGVNSVTGSNEPLYVVDGIPIEGYNGKVENSVASINPNDIVSMEILKDASATAIYGSRGANGVVLITTRRGEVGKNTLSYEGYYGVQQLPTRVDVMNLQQYATYMNERYKLLGWQSREEFKDPSILGKGTDWQKELFSIAPMQNHQLTLNSGTEKTQMSLSGAFFRQDGIAMGSGYDRFSFRMNVDNKTYSWLNTGLSMMASLSKQKITISDGDIISRTIGQSPDVPARMPDGSWGGPSTPFNLSNPVAEASITENKNRGVQLLGNFFADITFAKGLVLRSEAGGNVNYSNIYYFLPTYTFGSKTNSVNTSTRTAENSQYWIVKNYLTYSAKFAEKHDFSFMAGHEAQATVYESLSGTRNTFTSNDLHELNLGDASSATNTGSKGHSSLESYFGRLNYSYADKYLLTATYRADGSSKFGPNKRWGYFPSFAAAWRVTGEEFMKKQDVISNMKLRLGWGQVGNQNIADYAYGATLGVVQTEWGSGVLTGKLANPDVQWESTESSNIGLDLGFLKNRIEFIVDVYKKTTDNLLMQPPYPLAVGTATWTGEGGVIAPWVNVGAIQNKGIELTLNTVNIDNGTFSWKTGIMFSRNVNKITKLTTDNAIVNGLEGTDIITQSVVGKPVGQFYGYVIDGMFNKESDFYQKNSNGSFKLDANGNKIMVALPTKTDVKPGGVWYGDFRYKDLNGDGVIDEKDRAYIGNPDPKFQFGINNSFSWGNFDMNVYLTGVYGNKIYNMIRVADENPGNNYGLLASVSDYARLGIINPDLKQGDLTASQILSNVYVINAGTGIPRVTLDDPNANSRISDRFVEDGSYLRIKNISIGYTIPAKVLSKVGLAGLRVYANIQNLYTFTNYSGYDPEIGSQRQNMILSSIDYGRYPTPRIYTFGMSLTF